MPALSTLARAEYYAELGGALPPPVPDQPEFRERRRTTAVEAFDALRPGDAFEARLAVQIVLAGAHATDRLREAGLFREDFSKMGRCRAQAAGMMREARAARRMLAQEQKMRLGMEGVVETGKGRTAAASALPLQAEPRGALLPVRATDVAALPAAAAALPAPAGAAPPQAPTAAPRRPTPPPNLDPLRGSSHQGEGEASPTPVPAIGPPRPAASQAAPLAATHAAPPAQQTASAPPPSPDAVAKAEAFARAQMVAAAQIRHDRGVTPLNKAYFPHLTLPTDPAVVDALVRGTSAVMIVLEEVGGEKLEAAA
jgi:hypothetical protein